MAERCPQLVAKRRRIDGMYRSLFCHPDLIRHISDLGTLLAARFGGLAHALRELLILWVARELGYIQGSLSLAHLRSQPPAAAADIFAGKPTAAAGNTGQAWDQGRAANHQKMDPQG